MFQYNNVCDQSSWSLRTKMRKFPELKNAILEIATKSFICLTQVSLPMQALWKASYQLKIKYICWFLLTDIRFIVALHLKFLYIYIILNFRINMNFLKIRNDWIFRVISTIILTFWYIRFCLSFLSPFTSVFTHLSHFIK